MEDKNTQVQIDEINKKLDVILEEIEHQRSHRREMEDLKSDLMRVGTDLYHTAVNELEEMHDHIDTGDIMHLGKKLLRNVNTISNSIEQLESIRDFISDVAPLTRESIIDLMAHLDDFDRKGYFDFIKEFQKGIDNVVTSFTVEDVKHLSENMVTILNTVKSLTQPDMLHAINNAVDVYKNLDIHIKGDISYWELFKEAKSPEMRRGLAFAIRSLKNLVKQQSISR